MADEHLLITAAGRRPLVIYEKAHALVCIHIDDHVLLFLFLVHIYCNIHISLFKIRTSKHVLGFATQIAETLRHAMRLGWEPKTALVSIDSHIIARRIKSSISSMH